MQLAERHTYCAPPSQNDIDTFSSNLRSFSGCRRICASSSPIDHHHQTRDGAGTVSHCLPFPLPPLLLPDILYPQASLTSAARARWSSSSPSLTRHSTSGRRRRWKSPLQGCLLRGVPQKGRSMDTRRLDRGTQSERGCFCIWEV
jgi:hypothetical protein